jgi:probable rRNA maturation factor
MRIAIDNDSGQECDEKSIKSVAEFVMNQMGLHPDSELAIRLVDLDEMSDLHMQWMDESGPTDVLSFPMDELTPNSAPEGPGMLGDVVLCPDFAKQNGKQSLEKELLLLTVHGVLHLLGFDHRQKDEEQVMFKLQSDLIKEWANG